MVLTYMCIIDSTQSYSQRAVTLQLRRITRNNFNITLRCCCYCRRYCLLVVLWIITGLWPNAFSYGWALLSTGLISWVALYCLYCLCYVNCTKFGNLISAGAMPQTLLGACSAPPGPLTGGEGLAAPSQELSAH